MLSTVEWTKESMERRWELDRENHLIDSILVGLHVRRQTPNRKKAWFDSFQSKKIIFSNSTPTLSTVSFHDWIPFTLHFSLRIGISISALILKDIFVNLSNIIESKILYTYFIIVFNKLYLITPPRTVPVKTVPFPLIEKQWSTAIRNGDEMSRIGSNKRGLMASVIKDKDSLNIQMNKS